MKRILCFGDSNTYGYDALCDGRFDPKIRWTGLLQKAFQGQAMILEAGQNGRTCGFDDPVDPRRNGRGVLAETLERFWPLDGVVVMLGTNDTKEMFHASAEEITQQMEQLLVEIQRYGEERSQKVTLLLLAPVPLSPDSGYYIDFNQRSLEVSQALGAHYRVLAKTLGIAFADAAEWDILLDFDGTHYTPAGHRQFARRMEGEMVGVFGLWEPASVPNW